MIRFRAKREATQSVTFAEFDRQYRAVCGAWAVTMAGQDRAWERRAWRTQPPAQDVREPIARQIREAAACRQPRDWLSGHAEYVGVAVRDLLEAGGVAVASNGVLAIFPPGVPANRAHAARASFKIDRRRTIEHAILGLISEDSAARQTLSAIGAGAEPKADGVRCSVQRKIRSMTRYVACRLPRANAVDASCAVQDRHSPKPRQATSLQAPVGRGAETVTPKELAASRTSRPVGAAR